MNRLELRFLGQPTPELHETMFIQSLGGKQIRAIRGKTQGAHANYGTFQWTRAVRALAVFLLRAKSHALSHNGEGSACPPLLSGYASSLAASLDDALHKQPIWLADMFGVNSAGAPLAKKLIKRTNPGRRRCGPVSVALNLNVLPWEAIDVYWGDELVEDPTKVSRMATAIEAAITSKTTKDGTSQAA